MVDSAGDLHVKWWDEFLKSGSTTGNGRRRFDGTGRRGLKSKSHEMDVESKMKLRRSRCCCCFLSFPFLFLAFLLLLLFFSVFFGELVRGVVQP